MNAHRVFYLVFYQGNIVDPHDMLDKFEVDTFRWYVACGVLAGFLVTQTLSFALTREVLLSC